MATSIVGSAVINAFAFSAGSWLFSKLSHSGYLEEQRRHNEALEALTKAKEKFIEEEAARKDHLAKLERELAKANQDEIATNRALDILAEFKKANPPLKQPMLTDFYTPSDEQKKYNTIAVVFLALLFGGSIFLAYRYFF